MQILIHNPAFPKDTSKAVPLSAAQFAVVQPLIVQDVRLPKSQRLSIASMEAQIIKLCADAGLPIKF